MTNGTLLTSLLGITSVNPSVAKASAAKTSAVNAGAEAAEKFQQTLEQVRPEVAARKADIRKDHLPVAQRPEPKRVDREARPEPGSAAEAANERAPAGRTRSEPGEKSPPLARTEAGAEPLEENPDIAPSSESEAEAGEAGAQTAAVDETAATPEACLIAPDNPWPLGAGGEANLPSPELLLAATGGLAIDPGAVVQVAGGQPTPPDPALLAAAEPEVLPSLLAAQVPGALADPASELASLATPNGVAAGQVAAGLVLTGAAVDAQTLASQVSSGYLASLADDGLSQEGSETQLDPGSAAGADYGENPDLLLLNSKAALNKLAEASMAAASLDKAAPAADLAKPAAVPSAIDTLTRLAEAQSPATRAFVVQTGVPVPLGSPQWSQAVGDKVLWLAAQNVSAAEIRLDPPELGPLQVKVSVNQDQASISFTSPHPGVREALDQQLNRLRDMFSEQGLNLVNVDVSDKSFAQQERERQESSGHFAAAGQDEEELVPVAMSQAGSMRLVDHYA